MIPTYVFGFPTGREKGDYLAVDLGAFVLRFPRCPNLMFDTVCSSSLMF